MRRVTILFDDERLYREIKAEAAKEGRPVKDVVAEALQDWLRRRTVLTSDEVQRRRDALSVLDAIRASQPIRETVDEALAALRVERS
jgi:hypothetical protein